MAVNAAYHTRIAAPRGGSILNTLQAADMSDRKRLPAEILAAILNYLLVADQIRCARASRKLREMVYDDTRWVAKLKSMGCWDEVEARRIFDEAAKRRREMAEQASGLGASRGANRQSVQSTITLFDAESEGRRRRRTISTQDGFKVTTLESARRDPADPAQDPAAFLDVFKSARSIRGYARQEYGKIHGALAPFYFDLMRAQSHADPAIFRAFRDPEKQAQMLANLRQFARSDWAQGWSEREEKLTSMINIFETAVLREFEQGYEFWDVDGRMHRYAHVLHTLNGGNAGNAGNAGVELFVQKHPILNDRRGLPDPLACINQAPQDEVILEPSSAFLEQLLSKVNEQAGVIERIFPNPEAVFWAFVDKVREDVVMEYTVPLFEQAHERSLETYLKAVSGMFGNSTRFYQAVAPPRGCSRETVASKAKELSQATFDPHLDTYLREELEFFANNADNEVGKWDRQISEQDATVESFYMSSFNRQADKKDFLSSFRKVVMMPVNVLPTMSLPLGSPFASPKPAATTAASGISASASAGQSCSCPETAGTSDKKGGGQLPGKAPDDELAAKAALMASRLEGIKSLLSIEVALNLVHAAKTSLERIAVFIPLGGQWGGEAKEQCAAVFITMLRTLGSRHIKRGFDIAVDHLSKYNPREVGDHDKSSVAPLVVFIELVNVGDLISQMIDVFYEQQLTTPKISDKNDFLDPAVLAKKKFEQMLDESVAAGLNKGIDVLMDEVDYVNSTTQLPTDFNPPQVADGRAPSGWGVDVGPTAAAKRVVGLVSSHTGMLVGTTEKGMLDVFNGEVGLRLFHAVCKHLKRQRISTSGSVRLIADMNHYFEFVRTLRNQDLLAYFRALRELSQIYLIDARHAKEMAAVIADGDRFGGIFRAEEVYEFAQRRADWYQVRKDVERAMYGLECSVM